MTERTPVGDRVTIYTRGTKNTYVADFWEGGVHRRVSLKTANKKVALGRAAELAADLGRGGYRPAPPPVTVRRACDDYLLTLTTAGRARKTTVKYAGVFRTMIEFLGRRRATHLHQLTATVFDAWRAERAACRHPRTVYTEGVIVKQFTAWAVTRKLLPDDPLAGIRLGKPYAEPKAGPSLAEVDAILAAATGPLRDWLTVLAFTGMRVGELQRLRVTDVDLAGGWVHVRSRPGAETKTRDSRKVPIHPRLRVTLERVARGGIGWLFTAAPSRKYPGGGHWISPKRVNDQLARVLGRLGLPAGRAAGFVVHSLRHFFETFAVNAGVPQRAVDAWLGHHSDKSMGAVYYRLLDADSQRFMAAVPFGPATGERSPAGPDSPQPTA